MNLLTPAEVEMIKYTAQSIVDYDDSQANWAPASYFVSRKEIARLILRLVENYKYLVEERKEYLKGMEQ